jgi:hypothetical protein
MIKSWLLCGMMLLLVSCSYTDVVVVGPVAEEIDHNKVDVYYGQLPECEVTTIAHLRAPGEFLTRQGLVNTFKQKAATLGAPAIQILDIQKSGSTNFYGSARAISCASN